MYPYIYISDFILYWNFFQKYVLKNICSAHVQVTNFIIFKFHLPFLFLNTVKKGSWNTTGQSVWTRDRKIQCSISNIAKDPTSTLRHTRYVYIETFKSVHSSDGAIVQCRRRFRWVPECEPRHLTVILTRRRIIRITSRNQFCWSFLLRMEIYSWNDKQTVKKIHWQQVCHHFLQLF